MAVENQTDFMWVGNSRTWEFTITDADASGSPAKDLGDFTVLRWTLSFPDSPDAEVTKTIGDGITVVDAANGRCDVAITNADTASLPIGDYTFQLEGEDASGNSTVLATGTITLKLNVGDT